MSRLWLRQVRRVLGLERTPAAPVRTRRRLGVETLEDRSVPAAFTVTSLADTVANDGVVTLREAIAAANADAASDDITFQAGLTGTIVLTGRQLAITNPVTITGNGAANTIIDAQQRSRIFDYTDLRSAGNLTLAGLTLTNGDAYRDTGGAVNFYTLGTLLISDCTLSNNSTALGGAVYAALGSLSVSGSTFSGNSATEYGGAIYGNGVSVSGSTFAGNSASNGGAIDARTVSVSWSTFVGNVADGSGGAISSNSAAVTVSQCTLAGNTATSGWGGAIYSESGAVAVTQSTVAGNTAIIGGGILSLSGPVAVRNSIVAGNTGTAAAPDISPGSGGLTVESSLIGRNDGTGLTPTGPTPDASGNLIGSAAAPIDPKLGPLANNGGPTQTMTLLADSPARNRGSATIASSFTTDQRGAPFARVYGGGRVDMGAFEALELVVDTNADEDDGNYGPGDLSLREAIRLANASAGPDAITFRPGLTGTIALTGGQMLITDAVTITGNGAANTVLDAQRRSRIFKVTAGDVTLAGLTLTNGKVTNASGGAVLFDSAGTLTVVDSTLSGNSADSDGGAGGAGGAIYAVAAGSAVRVSGSTFSGNSADWGGGAICAVVVSVSGSTFSGNSAVGGLGGAIYANRVSVSGSTFSGNSAGKGGAIYSLSAAVTVSQSTLAGNTAAGNVGWGGAIYSNSGAVAVTQSTISGNTANSGGGIYSVSGPVTVRNSIVAGNTGTAAAPDISPGSGGLTVESSLIGRNDGTGLTPTGPTPDASGNLIGSAAAPIDPRLGPLANNGGPTQTMTLLADSPARNRGSAAVASAFTTDQRGAPFARVYGGGTVDMGAFEALELVVDTNVDEDDGNYGPGDLSLREAIRLANANPGADAITFQPGLTGTIALTGGEMTITSPVTITGNGAANTVIDAQKLSRIFNIFNAGDVTLTGLTLTNGKATNNDGGAVLFESSGTLTVSNSTLSGNAAVSDGGAIFATTAGSAVLVSGCTFAGNSASNGNGGAIDASTVSVTGSTFAGNSADAATGGAINSFFGSASVSGSTFIGNSARLGGAIYSRVSTVTVTQSTLAGNAATIGVGLGGAICSDSGAVTVTQSTVAGNTANTGGGIYSLSGPVTVRNSIVAGNRNTDGGTAPDMSKGSGALTVESSLIGTNAGTALTASAAPDANGNIIGDATGIDPRLGPLGNNGGPTQTMAVLADSPARNRGSAAVASGFTTDQRGGAFSRNRDGAADMGAFEDQRLSPTDLALSSNTIPENQPAGTLVGRLSAIDPDATSGGSSGGNKGGGTGGSPAPHPTPSPTPPPAPSPTPPPAPSPTPPSLAYALVSGVGDSGNAAFTIVGNELRTNTDLIDFEGRSTYSVRVRATDPDGLWTEGVFTITVADVNEPPTDVTLSNGTVAENQPAGTLVGALGTADPDAGDAFTYELVSGDGDSGNAMFGIDVAGNLVTAGPLDFEAQASYSVRVRSTDAAGLSTEKVLRVGVLNVNEAPKSLRLSANTVAENQPAGTLIGLLTATDPDNVTSGGGGGGSGGSGGSSDGGGGSGGGGNGRPGGQPDRPASTFSLVTGEGDSGNGAFQIVGNVLQTAAILNFESQPSYSVRVRATDPDGLWTEGVFTIMVADINEPPADITLSNGTVVEYQPAGTLVGALRTADPDAGDAVTYELVGPSGGPDDGWFTVDAGGNLRTARAFDAGARSSYPVRVRSTDAGGLFTERAFAVTVTSVRVASDSPGGGARAAAADFTGDGVADTLVATGPGTPARLSVVDGATGQTVWTMSPFESTFTAGVNVAAADLTGDGIADVAVGADAAGGPRVTVFDGATGAVLADFFGIDDPGFRGGVRVALGDVSGDGLADLAVSAGAGGGPRVALWDGASLRPGSTPARLVRDFFGFEPTQRGGAAVALGDVNGDGRADLILSGGPGGGPRVLIWDAAAFLASNGETRTPLADFFAAAETSRGGARVSARDLDGDPLADVVVAIPTGPAASVVRAYLGRTLTPAGTPPVFDEFSLDVGGVFLG
ncbi:MAG: choice-of-anchor Q domain-containing protein [Gemmataceae bacterium]